MKKTICVGIAALFVFASFTFFNGGQSARADELSDNVNEQLEELDLSGLTNYSEEIGFSSVLTKIKDMLSGEYSFDYSSVLNYILSAILGSAMKMLPAFITIIAIAVFFALFNGLKSSFSSEGTSEIIFYVCFSAIVLIIISQGAVIFIEVQNNIKNLSILCEIMSPIIVSLMVASGGSVSAAIYSPAAAFLSGGIIAFILSVILPLINALLVFEILANSTKAVKLKKYSALISSVIKWSIGLIVAVFGIFMTAQGLAGGIQDGISLKAAKYVLSNSVPLVGGLLRDGFDLILAGTVLIKNAVGIAVVFLIFYTVLAPALYIGAFSLLLKTTAALIETIADERLSELCISVSKYATYLLVALLLAGLMLFITVLLMTFSVGAAAL